MSWSLSARAHVSEIGGALRAEIDHLVHQRGTPIGEAETTAINAAIASANQIATSGAVGTQGVGVVLSGHTDEQGRTGTVSIAVSSYELEPPAVGPVEGRPDARLRHDLEDTVSTTNPFGPGEVTTEPVGQTDTDAALALQGERAAIERDRADDEQQRARREEALKLQREAATKGTIPGADVVIGPERRPNDAVTQAQEERDRALAAPADDHGHNPNAAFLEHLDSANPDATGELVPGADGEPQRITGEELLAQPPPGAEASLTEAPAPPAEEHGDAPAPPEGAASETEGAAAASPAAASTSEARDVPSDNLDDVDDPGEVTKARLQELADEHELPRSGTKAELFERLHEAGVEVTPE